MSFGSSGYHDIDSSMNQLYSNPSMISTDQFDVVYHPMGQVSFFPPDPDPTPMPVPVPAPPPSSGRPVFNPSILQKNWSCISPGKCTIVPIGHGQYRTQKECINSCR